MSILKGKCPKCGASYYGWALNNPNQQQCERCGCELDIFENRKPIVPNHDLLSYPEYETIAKQLKKMSLAN